MVKITIDGSEHEVEAGLTILQACEQVGVEILALKGLIDASV